MFHVEEIDMRRCSHRQDRVLPFTILLFLSVLGPRVLLSNRAQSNQAAAPVVAAPDNLLFRFGVITDLHWWDRGDGMSANGVPRYYRQALAGLSRAVDHFQKVQVDFAVNLGDVIDCPKEGQRGGHSARSEQALQGVLDVFGRLGRPVLHMLGNHCLECMARSELNRRLGIDAANSDPSQPHSYYAYSPHPGWRLLVLDSYGVSVVGWPPGHPHHREAARILDEKNPNQDKNENSGMHGWDKRFVAYGGGVGEAQLRWLEQQLQEARNAGERVLVCTHMCIHPRSCAGPWFLWDFEAVLQLLHSFSDVVVATLAGHAHKDGYYRDETGIHHRVFTGVVESPPGSDAYAIIEVHSSRESRQKIAVIAADGTASVEWDLERTK